MFESLLNFWFDEIKHALWWEKDTQFDKFITEEYSSMHAKAIKCELFEWRQSARGRLAEIIVLDQFSRNMFRDSALSFANDSLALALAQEAVALGADNELNPIERGVLYLPYMHSESRKIHEVALALYKKNSVQANIDFEIKHKNIIDQFGRYPHRNAILNRESTQQELAFIQKPNSGF